MPERLSAASKRPGSSRVSTERSYVKLAQKRNRSMPRTMPTKYAASTSHDRLTDAELLADLRRVLALAHGKRYHQCSGEVYKRLGGKHHVKTFLARWGSWEASILAVQGQLGTAAPTRLLRVRQTTMNIRLCLRCDRRFPSEGPHNRLCNPCRALLDAQPSAPEYGIITQPRHR